MTFTIGIKRGVLMRDGYHCAMLGAIGCDDAIAFEVNHRLNRGSGGHGDDSTSNACAISTHCNSLIEDDDAFAIEAKRRGVKLLHGDDPELVPMWSPLFAQWVELKRDGLHLTGVRDPSLNAREWRD